MITNFKMNKLKTINIKGKEYVMVVERVKEAHNIFDGKISITTEIVNVGENRVAIKATVTLGEHVFTGHSQAEWGKGMMGNVALEVAETSAIGRALGFANIGLLEGIASADEVVKAQNRNYTPADTIEMVKLKTNWIADPDKRKEQNDKIKKLGGKWNADEKSWFVPKNVTLNDHE